MEVDSLENGKKYCKIGEAAKYMYVSSQALRNWERQGLLVPDEIRDTGHRKYECAKVIEFRKKFEKKPIPEGVQLMTTGDVCEYLGVGTTVLRRLISENKISPALVLPPTNRMLFIPSEIKEYLESTLRG